MKSHNTRKILLISLIICCFLSACNPPINEKPTPSADSLRNETFLINVLNGVNDINESITIVEVPDDHMVQSERVQIIHYAVVNNTDEIVQIPFRNLLVGYLYDEETGEWTMLQRRVVDSGGIRQIDLVSFNNDWMNAFPLELNYISTILKEKSAVVRVLVLGEIKTNTTDKSVAAWIDIPYNPED